MRIAYVTGRFPMLSEPFIMNQVVGALQRGCDAHVFAVQGRPEATGKVHADFARHRLAERTHYPAQPPEGTVARRASVEAALASLAEAQPRAAAALRRMAGAPGPVPWKTILRGAEIARHGPFDVIHCQFGFFADQVLALREAGVHDAAVVTTFRGGDISRYVDEQGPEVYARTFAAGDHFLANCAFFRDRAVAIGCPADRLEVHGSGIDLSRFTYKARLAPAEGPVRIATTGRLVEKKGVVYALEAVELLRHGGFDVHFDVLGDGPLRAELKGYAARLGIAEAVTFHGWRTQAEIVEILDDCHLFVASSVTADNGDQDAPVNTLKEAMAMGLPVVASDHGGIPELVRDGIAGFLVPERDGKAIAVALARLVSRAPMWPDMGAAGRAAVAAQFDLAALNDRLVELYGSLVAARRERRQADAV